MLMTRDLHTSNQSQEIQPKSVWNNHLIITEQLTKHDIPQKWHKTQLKCPPLIILEGLRKSDSLRVYRGADCGYCDRAYTLYSSHVVKSANLIIPLLGGLKN